jgi:3-hydroxyphenylacetate 6-hydroxylase
MSFTAFLPSSPFATLKVVSLYTISSLLTLTALYLVQNEVYRYTRRIKKLPGPRGWPVVGNLFQVRQVYPELNYATIGQVYQGN